MTGMVLWGVFAMVFAREGYRDDGPSRPPSAPERRSAAVVWCPEVSLKWCGMWRKARTGRGRSSWILKVMGLMLHGWFSEKLGELVLGGWARLLILSSGRLAVGTVGGLGVVVELFERSIVIGWWRGRDAEMFR